MLLRQKKQIGFSVEPREDCPHLGQHVALGTAAKIGPAFAATACETCADKTENWICIKGGITACTRYVNGHAKNHAESSGHQVALSFSDLSVWCYSCADYVKHPLLNMFVGELHKAKFGEEK